MDNCFEFRVFNITLGTFRSFFVWRILDRQKDVSCVLCILRFYHILDDIQDLFSALYELSAKSLIRLLHASFVEKAVAVGVGNAANETIAYEDQDQSVEQQVVHYGCIRYLSLVEPIHLGSDEVQHWEDGAVNQNSYRDYEPMKDQFILDMN